MEKLGIDNLKKAISGLMSVGLAVDKALEDKDISRAEAIQIGIKTIGFAGTLAFNWNAVKSEYRDLDPEERQAIKDYVKTEFDLDDDYVEEKIEKGFNVAIALDEFFAVKKSAA